jgi:hypothetical protein
MSFMLPKEKATTLWAGKEEGKIINADLRLLDCEDEGWIELKRNRIQLWPLFPAVLTLEILLLLS